MRAKLKRLAEVDFLPNIIQEGKPLYKSIKGNWGDLFFANNKPIVLELACGRGEYTTGLARVDPDRNYIGIDIKGDRVWKGATVAIEEGLNNVGFLRTNIRYLDQFFGLNEIDEIWITFPDPRPKDRDEKHRLTNNTFLDLYSGVLNNEGWIKFKTDNTALFDYTLEVLAKRNDISNLAFTYDLYDSGMLEESKGIRTRFEQKHSALGEKIKFLKFQYL